MIYMININTEIFLRSVKDLNKLKLLVEVNNLDRPNFSAIARELGVDRRTVKKYYDGDIKKVRKSKKSKIDDFYDIISSLLSAETDQIFYYKSHLYRYLVREKGLDCSRSNFNYYILFTFSVLYFMLWRITESTFLFHSHSFIPFCFLIFLLHQIFYHS